MAEVVIPNGKLYSKPTLVSRFGIVHMTFTVCQLLQRGLSRGRVSSTPEKSLRFHVRRRRQTFLSLDDRKDLV